MFVFDEDSVANDRAALTSADGVVLGFTPAHDRDDARRDRGPPGRGELLGLDDSTDLDWSASASRSPSARARARAWTIARDRRRHRARTRRCLTLTGRRSGSGTPTDRSEFRIAGRRHQRPHHRLRHGTEHPVRRPAATRRHHLRRHRSRAGQPRPRQRHVAVDYATNAEDHITERERRLLHADDARHRRAATTTSRSSCRTARTAHCARAQRGRRQPSASIHRAMVVFGGTAPTTSPAAPATTSCSATSAASITSRPFDTDRTTTARLTCRSTQSSRGSATRCRSNPENPPVTSATTRPR